jgi:membrane protein implicated in regulation of membrane protease activity
MFEIALGILLAVLILAFLPYIIFGGLIALAVAAAVAVAAISCLLAAAMGLPWWLPLPVLALAALVARASSNNPTDSTKRDVQRQRKQVDEVSQKSA